MKKLILLTLAASIILSAQVTITYPSTGNSVGNIANSTGTVVDPAGVKSVTISIDNGAPQATTLYAPNPDGSVGWLFALYAKLMPIGNHVMVASELNNAGVSISSAPVNFTVIHSTPLANNSPVGQGAVAVSAAPINGGTFTFPNGYPANATILVGLAANNRNVPWVLSDITNTSNLQWKFCFPSVDTGDLDNHLVQVALFCARTTSAITTQDVITPISPGSTFTVGSAVVYTGLGDLDGTGGYSLGWGGVGVDSTSGPFSTTVNDILVGFALGAPVTPASGWTERVEDNSRPFTIIADTIATGTTATYTTTMNPEGYLNIGIAFKPATINCTVDPVVAALQAQGLYANTLAAIQSGAIIETIGFSPNKATIPVWAPNTAYGVGQQTFDANGNLYTLAAINLARISSSTTPAWNVPSDCTTPAQTQDYGITWTFTGCATGQPSNVQPWQPGGIHFMYDMVTDAAGNFYTVSNITPSVNSSLSGSVTPVWNIPTAGMDFTTIPFQTQDAYLVWTFTNPAQ